MKLQRNVVPTPRVPAAVKTWTIITYVWRRLRLQCVMPITVSVASSMVFSIKKIPKVLKEVFSSKLYIQAFLSHFFISKNMRITLFFL